jgi:2-oxoglutarate ferredoxin oxidoreductase subunit delta
MLKDKTMAKARGAIEVEIEKCKGCELCVGSCPFHVIDMHQHVNSKGYHYAFMGNPEACTGCTNCAVVCPDGVITVYRAKSEL